MPWSLGPADGRHVLRAGAGTPITHVVALSTLGAARRERLIPGRRMRGRDVSPEPDPAPVTIGRATVINVDAPLADTDAARAWLDGAGEDELAAGLAVVSRVLDAHRLVTADPAVRSVGRDQLAVARIGFGAGDQVAHGRWTRARELGGGAGVARARRRRMPDSDARLAAVLGGEDQPLVCEELVLRARDDLDHDRSRAAALQLPVALDAAIAELSADPRAAGLSERISALRDRRETVARAAQAALRTQPGSKERRAVAETVALVEATLRARRRSPTAHHSASDRSEG